MHSIDRRTFLGALAAIAAAPTLLTAQEAAHVAAPAEEMTFVEQYHMGYIPSGHVKANHESAIGITCVMIDGVPRNDVVEANDIEGWAMVLSEDSHPFGEFAPFYMRVHGDIRFLREDVLWYARG